ncbi:MAG: PhzF family phenazine biosynthesis protein, partial [Chitinophagaceae bacterium]
QQVQNQIVMKFPIYDSQSDEAPIELLEALGIQKTKNTEYNKETNILLIEIDDSQILRQLKPDFEMLKKSHDSINGVLVTSKSQQQDIDFESRYFWPWSGTNEDPVTGGTHTFLTPYWSKRLNKKKMTSFQCSERTGQMEVEILNEQWFTIKSTARIVFEGCIRI